MDDKLDYDLPRGFDRCCLYSATCYQSEVRQTPRIDNQTVWLYVDDYDIDYWTVVCK